MGFNFPATPAPGEVFQGWQWDGEKWKGGQPSGPQKEQFFDLSGKAYQDIAVPTWAKACQIIGFVRMTASAAVVMRISVDGTNFLVGASDYYNGGPTHGTGTANFTTTAGVFTSVMFLTQQADNLNQSHSFTAEMELVRGTTSHTFAQKAYGKSFDSAAGTQLRTYHNQAYVVAAQAGGALTVKALRFLMSPGSTFGAGYLHVKWLGDDAQVPISNAIPDCPSDGGEYVRANGDWRLKGQTYDLAGLASQNILVPAWGPGFARLGIYAHGTAAVPTNIILRASGDGTTYPVGPNSEYAQGGFLYRTGTAGVVTDVAWGFRSIELATTANTTEHASRSDTLVQLKRANTSQEYAVMTRGDTYHALAGWAFNVMTYGASIKGGTTLSLKGLQVLTTTGTWVAGSRLNVEWLA